MGAVAFASVVDRDDHDTGRFHPERPRRLVAIESGLARHGLSEWLVRIEPRPASAAELGRVHDERYLDALAKLCEVGGGTLDPDTPVTAGSYGTAVTAAGLGLQAVAALRRGEATCAFVAPRPPGHHAGHDRGMGFCLVNNVAVTAAALVAGGERVAVVDWDVHHGNGTQDVFWDEPAVLVASMHEWPAYPGTGRAGEVGGENALGATLNVPLPERATGDVALAAFDELIGPAVDAFAPDWVLVSAGFDAHRADPLAGLEWSSGDFAALTRRVLAIAPPRRVVAFLEGGYDLEALGRSVAATVAAMVGEDIVAEPPTCGGPGRDAVAAAARTRARTLGGAP